MSGATARPHLTLSEALERGRRAKLHAQIGALTRELDNLKSQPDWYRNRRYFKLKTKLGILEGRLNQAAFVIET